MADPTFDELMQMVQAPPPAQAMGPNGLPVVPPLPSEQGAQPVDLDALLNVVRRPELLQEAGAPSSDQGAMARSVRNFGTASTSHMATIAGLPVDIVDAVLSTVVSNPGYQRGDAATAIRRALGQIGVDAHDYDPQSFASRLGATTVESLLGLAALRGLAPSMAGRPAAGVPGTATPAATPAGQIVQGIGEAALARPLTTATQAIAAGPGIVAGTELGGNIGEATGGRVGRALGEAGGGLIGGGITGGIAETLGRRVSPGLAREALPGLQAQPNPLISATADQQGALNTAAGRIRQEVADIDNAIERALRGVNPSGASGPEASAAAQQALLRVQAHAENVESQMWSRIPRQALIDVEPTINELLAQTGRNNTIRPQWTWDNQDATRLMIRAGDIAEQNGSPRGFMLSADDALRFRSAMLEDMRRANSVNPEFQNRRLAAGLNQLQGQLLNDIEHSLPGNTSVAEARAFSLEMNNRFNRGPIAQVTATDSGGNTRVPGQQMIPTLLGNERGIHSLHTATQPYPGIGITGFRERGQLRSATDAAIRAQYADIADNAVTPTGEFAGRNAGRLAGRFSRQNERLIQDFTNAHAETEQATNFIQQQLIHQTEVNASVLAKAVNQNPQQAITTILTGDNPTRDTADMLRRIGGNQQALEGFQALFVSGLLRQSRQDPTAALSLVRGGPLQRSAEAIFGTSGYERLVNNLEAGSAIQRGDISALRSVGVAAGSVLSRVLGLHFGHIMANALAGGTGAGTLSLPARMANNFAGRFNTWASMGDPAQVFQQMMVNPRYEALMLSRVPNSAREAAELARSQNAWMRRILSTRSGTGQAVIDSGRALLDSQDAGR